MQQEKPGPGWELQRSSCTGSKESCSHSGAEQSLSCPSGAVYSCSQQQQWHADSVSKTVLTCCRRNKQIHLLGNCTSQQNPSCNSYGITRLLSALLCILGGRGGTRVWACALFWNLGSEHSAIHIVTANITVEFLTVWNQLRVKGQFVSGFLFNE